MATRRRQRARAPQATTKPTVEPRHEPTRAIERRTPTPPPTPRTQVAERPAPSQVRTFKNAYLSVSRIRKYAQCPHSFRLSYIDRVPKGTNDNLVFGSLVHLSLEAINRWAVAQEFVGTVPDEVMVDAFRAAFKACEISTEEMYQEGLDVIREWFRSNPEIDSTRILGIEQEFRFKFEGREILGYIDRVDKLDDDTLLVRDYKTNRIVFTTEETEADIQLSVYENAARLLYPWAKRVELAFDMVRHGRTLRTTRQHEDVVDALRYCIDVAEKSETDTEYKPRLNVWCAWCDHTTRCEAFQKALTDKPEFVAITQDDELDSIAEERERLVVLAKAIDGKRKALDKLISARLRAADEKSLTAAGVTYKLASRSNRVYTEPEKVVQKLVQFASLTEEQARKVLTVNATALDDFVKGLGLNRPQARMLKANLDSLCERKVGARYLDARPVKGSKK